jgi:hypothetical protein
MYTAAINRPSDHPSPRVPVTPALTGCSPPAGPLPPSAAATLTIHARQGAIIPGAVQESGPARPRPGQPGSQAMIVIARGDRTGEGATGSDEVQALAADRALDSGV